MLCRNYINNKNKKKKKKKEKNFRLRHVPEMADNKKKFILETSLRREVSHVTQYIL